MLCGKRQNRRYESDEEKVAVDGLPATRDHGDVLAPLMSRAMSGSVVLPQPGSV